MTTTSSVISAITPMSWVIRITARSRSAWSLPDQVQDLRLGRDVERGRRLVGDQDAGLGGERQRDHDPLAQPARELERVAVDPARRLRDADHLQQLDRARARRPLRQAGNAGGSPRSAGCRSCGRPRASSSAPGRRSRSRRRGCSHLRGPGRRAWRGRRRRPSARRSRIWPASTRPGRSTIRRIERAVTLLPQPLSPTMPSVRPGSRSKETPSTARTMPSSWWNQVLKAAHREDRLSHRDRPRRAGRRPGN